MTESSPPTGPFRVGDWDVDPSACRLLRGEREVAVEPLLMDVLVYLCRHREEVVSADRLIDELWSSPAVADGAVYRSIAQLRRVLGDDARRPRYIETISKRGYRLIAEVTPLQTPAVRGEAQRTGGPRGPWAWGVAGVLVLLIVAAASTWHQRQPAAPPGHVLPDTMIIPSIAVLPFENLDADEDLTYFGDGLSEEILNGLAQLEGLKVVARTSSFALRDEPRDIRRIASTLGVDHVLEGSVRRFAGTVRITAQLIDAQTGFHEWSRTFDRRHDEILAMQREVSDAVARELQVEILDRRSGGKLAGERMAAATYERYLRGTYFMRKVTPASLHKAQGLLREVIDREPRYAPAYAALADTYALLVQYNDEPLEKNGPEALALVNKALSLDPLLSAAHHSRGLVHFYGGDYPAAIAAFKFATELAPQSSSHLTMLARVLSFSDRDLDALPYIERAAALDPISPFVLVNHAHILLGLGRAEEAAARSRRAIEIAPDYLNSYWQLGWILLVDNDPKAAARQYELGISKGIRQAAIHEGLALAYLDLGRYDDALVAARIALRDAHAGGDSLVLTHHLTDTLRKGMSLTSDEASTDAPRAPNRLRDAFAAYLLGDCEDARRIYEGHLAAPSQDAASANLSLPGSMLIGLSHDLHLAHCYLQTGAPHLAKPLLDTLRNKLLEQPPSSRIAAQDYLLASISALEGDGDRAIAYLERAVDGGLVRYDWLMRDRALSSLISDPRFVHVAERMRSNALQAQR